MNASLTDEPAVPKGSRQPDGKAPVRREDEGVIPAHPPSSEDEEVAHAALFSAEDSDQFRAEWREIQAHFVDEPRQAVEQADRLVSAVTDHVTSVFTRDRTELEQQWAAGDEVSTEDLRRTLRRYRGFFQRLLNV